MSWRSDAAPTAPAKLACVRSFILPPRTARAAVSIELSEAQVDRVIRDASCTHDISLLLSGPADPRDVFASAAGLLEDPRLSRSLLCGVLLLRALPADGSCVAITSLARTMGMSASTAHRYVSTLLAVGLVERDATTRRYRRAHAP